MLSSGELSKEDGMVMVGRWGGEVAIQSEFEEAKDTSKAAGAKLCRREWELKSAWFATHIAFEV